MASAITLNPALNVFQNREIDPSVEEIFYTTTKPQTSIDQDGTQVFEVPAGQTPIYLKDILLSVECKITKADGTAIAATEKVGPANNVLHTLFSQVEVKLGDTVVSYNHSLYPYQAYLEELLWASASEKDGRLKMQGFILDTAGSQLATDPDKELAPNEGLKARRSLFAVSKNTLLIGRLHCDVFNQDKCLIEHVPKRISLQRSPNAFCLIKSGGGDFKISVSDMSLMIPRVRTSEALRRSMESALMNNLLATYNINRTVMQAHLIPSGVTNFNIPNLFRGRLPHTVVFAMAKADGRTASLDKVPFVFEHFKMDKIVLSRNNVAVNYHNGLVTDFGIGSNYTNAYLNLLMNTDSMSGGSLIRYDDFRAGYNVFVFKVTPQEDMYTDTCALNQGVLDLAMSFTAAIPENLDLFVLARFNATVTVDKDRVVTLNT